MLIQDIIKYVNKIVANNSSFKLNYNDLEFYINSAVDYINLELKTEMMNPQEQWENNLIVNNLIYNDLLKDTYTYLGEFEEHPFSVDNGIYYNTKDNNLYYCNEDTWELLDLNNLPELKELLKNTVLLNFDYNAIPDYVIRNVLIYYAAASYLEEEDEFESQYKRYLDKAEYSLDKIKQTYYSMYDLKEHHKQHKHEFKNPYGLPEGDD